MCTHRRTTPPSPCSAEIASSKSLASSGSMVKVARSRRSTRLLSSPSPAAASADSASTARGKARRRPRSSISPSTTSRATQGLPSRRRTLAPRLPAPTRTRSPSEAVVPPAPRDGVSTATRAPRGPNSGSATRKRPALAEHGHHRKVKPRRAPQRPRAHCSVAFPARVRSAIGQRLVPLRLGVVHRLHGGPHALHADVLATGQEVLAHRQVAVRRRSREAAHPERRPCQTCAGPRPWRACGRAARRSRSRKRKRCRGPRALPRDVARDRIALRLELALWLRCAPS